MSCAWPRQNDSTGFGALTFWHLGPLLDSQPWLKTLHFVPHSPYSLHLVFLWPMKHDYNESNRYKRPNKNHNSQLMSRLNKHAYEYIYTDITMKSENCTEEPILIKQTSFQYVLTRSRYRSANSFDFFSSSFFSFA